MFYDPTLEKLYFLALYTKWTGVTLIYQNVHGEKDLHKLLVLKPKSILNKLNDVSHVSNIL